ncbi:hypothetical protein EG329_007363 [Mollisiaceae sp. DMI_Dod_QoI]|nr:hypothetical protein EG329_007363 [Helotiales sp. DMI_Dod_QoI]
MTLSQIVVGIDFGTTYSGVSWALNRGNRQVNLITNWENPTAGFTNPNSNKVPTLISYENGSAVAWGFEAALSGDANLRWFKILLEPEYRYKQMSEQAIYSREILERMNKTPQDAVADYLQLLWQHAEEHIRHRIPKDDDGHNHELKVVITVPAMWSDVAKDQTREAAKKAGIPGEISLVSEPEAAALATFKDRSTNGEPLRKDDVYVVCDAGGGTVDLISYKIRSLDPLEIEECAIGDGGLCGSAYIDMGFEKFVKLKVGEAEYNRMNENHRKRMMIDFDVQVKRGFSGKDQKNRSVELRGVRNNAEEGIINGAIILSADSIRTLFDQVCSQVEDLVEKQIDEVEEKGFAVKAVLLVGGFGASRYLHHRLENGYKNRQKEIQVIQNAEA